MDTDGFDQVGWEVSRTDTPAVATFRSEAALDVLAGIWWSGTQRMSGMRQTGRHDVGAGMTLAAAEGHEARGATITLRWLLSYDCYTPFSLFSPSLPRLRDSLHPFTLRCMHSPSLALLCVHRAFDDTFYPVSLSLLSLDAAMPKCRRLSRCTA